MPCRHAAVLMLMAVPAHKLRRPEMRIRDRGERFVRIARGDATGIMTKEKCRFLYLRL